MMTTPRPFEMLLFHREAEFSEVCLNNGVDGLIVDLETRGKAVRQDGFDTQISVHSLRDLETAKSISGANVLCRINGPGPDTDREIRDVLLAGADEIIVPMVRHLDEAKAIVDTVKSRARLTMMVETVEASTFVPELCVLPIDRIYVGLNDLHISRGTSSIFDAMHDGLLDEIRARASGPQFGFGGMTLRDKGWPLSVRHIVGALARLEADFTFLRRSFYNDVAGHDPTIALAQMREDIQIARDRRLDQVAIDYAKMYTAIQASVPNTHA